MDHGWHFTSKRVGYNFPLGQINFSSWWSVPVLFANVKLVAGDGEWCVRSGKQIRLGGKLNILNKKFDSQHFASFKLLSRTCNSINVFFFKFIISVWGSYCDYSPWAPYTFVPHASHFISKFPFNFVPTPKRARQVKRTAPLNRNSPFHETEYSESWISDFQALINEQLHQNMVKLKSYFHA